MRTRRLAAVISALLVGLQLTACSDMGLTAAPAPTLIPHEPQRTQSVLPMSAFTKTVGMYYPRMDMSDLERKPMEIVCEEGLWLPEVLVHGLLEPVGDPTLYNLFGGAAQLNSITSCSGMLIVDLDYPEKVNDRELFASVLAMSRTLSLEAGAKSVLYLHNGSRIPMKGLISNPMSADLSLSTDTWTLQKFYLENGYFGAQFGGSYTPQEEQQMLFYADASGQHILCESLVIPTRRMSASLVDLLLSREPADGQGSLAERYGLTLASFSFLQEDVSCARVELLTDLDCREEYPMIRDLCALNLRMNDEKIKTVEIFVNGEPLQDEPYDASSARDRFGESMTLYFLKPEAGALVASSRVVSFAQSISPTAWMQALLEGPGAYDEPGLVGTFPEGIGAQDLIRVETDGMNAVVDLSARFSEAYPWDDPFMEKMMIYSAVNTLTRDNWIQQVIFRVEGQQLDHLGGELYLGTPLLSNPGLVVYEPDEKE